MITAGCSVRSAGGDEGQKQNEERSVRPPGDAHVEPYAVVVEITHASVTYTTMLGVLSHVEAVESEAVMKACAEQSAAANLHHWQKCWQPDWSFGCAFQRGSRMSANVQ
jgi:hypothetical protein